MLGLTTISKTTWPDPTFDELVGLAVDFGIVSRVRAGEGRIAMDVLNDPTDLSLDDAAILLKGLLLGYFYNQSRDDLSLARWAD